MGQEKNDEMNCRLWVCEAMAFAVVRAVRERRNGIGLVLILGAEKVAPKWKEGLPRLLHRPRRASLERPWNGVKRIAQEEVA